MKSRLPVVASISMVLTLLVASQAHSLPKAKSADCTAIEDSCDETIQAAKDACQKVEADMRKADAAARKVISQSAIFKGCIQARQKADGCKKEVINCRKGLLDSRDRQR